jgi:hypothetical protein
LLELLNKWYEFNKSVSDEELLKIVKEASTKKKAQDDSVVLMEAIIKLIKKR